MPFGGDDRQGEGSGKPLPLPALTSEQDPANVLGLEPGIPEFLSFSDTGFLWDLGFPVRPKAEVWERKVRVCIVLAAKAGWSDSRHSLSQARPVCVAP